MKAPIKIKVTVRVGWYETTDDHLSREEAIRTEFARLMPSSGKMDVAIEKVKS